MRTTILADPACGIRILRLLFGQGDDVLVVASVRDDAEFEQPRRADLPLDIADLLGIHLRNDDLHLAVAVGSNDDFLGAAGIDAVGQCLHQIAHVDLSRLSSTAPPYPRPCRTRTRTCVDTGTGAQVDLVDQHHAPFEIDAHRHLELAILKVETADDDQQGHRQRDENQAELPLIPAHPQRLGQHGSEDDRQHDHQRHDAYEVQELEHPVGEGALFLGHQHGQVQRVKHDRNFLIPEDLIVRVWVRVNDQSVFAGDALSEVITRAIAARCIRSFVFVFSSTLMVTSSKSFCALTTVP